MDKFNCSECTFVTQHFKRYMHHLELVHSTDSSFVVCCCIENCYKKYKIVQSYRRHIQRKHTAFYYQHVSPRGSCPTDDDWIQHSTATEDVSQTENDPIDDVPTVHLDENAENHSDTKRFARFLLKLREQKKLEKNILKEVVGEMGFHFKSCFQLIEKNIQKNWPTTGPPDISKLLSPLLNLVSMCEKLETEHKQDKYFRENFDVLSPVEVRLDTEDSAQQSYQYVPIRGSLEQLLQYEDILTEVLRGHRSEDGLLRDYCDGSAYAAHPVFSKAGLNLELQLYIDDFQTMNPIGNKTVMYKTTAIYFLLGNISPQLRSKLHVIQLVILCQACVVQQHGLDKILAPLVEDLKCLENGAEFKCADGKTRFFNIGISFIAADNLAAHSVSGLFESFSALKSCRFCHTSKSQMQNVFDEGSVQKRDAASHDIQVQQVISDPTLATAYGVKRKPILSELKHFHVIWNCPSCIAHDLFEGVAIDVLDTIVRHSIAKKYFTLWQLRDRIINFPYKGTDKTNKPTPMSAQVQFFKIKQTAAQMWCLLRLFPFLVGQFIPEDDEIWHVFKVFMDIVDIMCAPVISRGDIAFVQMCVTDFLARYSAIQTVHLKPKAHHMVHYASQLDRHGPLVVCWTMRFEAKHNYFKEIISGTKNRQNLNKTMATRHQFLQALYADEDNLFISTINSTKGKSVPVRLLNLDIQHLLKDKLHAETVYQVQSGTYAGVKYSVGLCVVGGFKDDEFIFGQIESIYIIGGDIHFIVVLLGIAEFNSHYHAYDVNVTDKKELWQPCGLLDYYPLAMYEIGCKCFLSMKYKVNHDNCK